MAGNQRLILTRLPSRYVMLGDATMNRLISRKRSGRPFRFSSVIHPVPFRLPDITLEHVQIAFAKLKSATAAGPDGWRAHEAKMLPQQFCEDLVLFYRALETSRRWPDSLTRAWLTPVPKKTRKAADTRPIAIMGIVYRIWSSLRRHTPSRLAGELSSRLPGSV